MQSLAGFNAARQQGANPQVVPGANPQAAPNQAGDTASSGSASSGKNAGRLRVDVPIPNGSAILNPGVSAASPRTPNTSEWVKQEDTSWVDKLLDSPL